MTSLVNSAVMDMGDDVVSELSDKLTELSVDNDVHKRTKSERSCGSGNDRPRKQSGVAFKVGSAGHWSPMDEGDEDRPRMEDVDRAIEDQEHPEKALEFKARSQRAQLFMCTGSTHTVRESPAGARDRIKSGLPPPDPDVTKHEVKFSTKSS
jgi:hypothetical protein